MAKTEVASQYQDLVIFPKQKHNIEKCVKCEERNAFLVLWYPTTFPRNRGWGCQRPLGLYSQEQFNVFANLVLMNKNVAFQMYYVTERQMF